MAGRVAGKVALITGAGRGQGRAHAVRLAEEGADIIAIDIADHIPYVQYPSPTEEDLAQTVREVEALDRRIVAATADVRDRAALKRAVDDGVERLGRLDIVAANAGVCVIAPWDETTEEIWDLTVDTDLKGVWNTITATAPHLIANGGGSIILTSSAAGLKGYPLLSAYVAAKHGIVGLMHAFALELAKHNIRVNSVHPTGVDTPMGSGTGGEELQRLLAENPNYGMAFANILPVQITQPIDISNAVLWLASDEARYVTSHTLAVDAGNTEL